MSRIMLDFRCPNGHVGEDFVDSAAQTVVCPRCGATATRLIAAPRIALDGISGDFPSASDAWEKRRESHMRKEKRNQERHGTYD
jgi:predicted nucleic acid-binding Zn ribbon protein